MNFLKSFLILVCLPHQHESIYHEYGFITKITISFEFSRFLLLKSFPSSEELLTKNAFLVKLSLQEQTRKLT